MSASHHRGLSSYLKVVYGILQGVTQTFIIIIMPAYVLVIGVVRVDEGGLGLGIVVVLVLVLLGLSGLKRCPCIFCMNLFLEYSYIFMSYFCSPRWQSEPGRRSGPRWGCGRRQGS